MIEKGDPRWTRLYMIWRGEKKPQYVVDGGDTYQAYEDNEDVKFALVGSQRNMYESVSIKVTK